jgi:hypothetical protein
MGHTMGSGRGKEQRPQASRTEASGVAEKDTRVPDPRTGVAGSAHGAAPTAAPPPMPASERSDSGGDAGRSWSLRPRGLALEDVRERWHTTQGAFIDDPERAVREADALASEVCDAVVAEMDARRTALRAAWEGGDGKDTESLRLAMRDYRHFVEHIIGGGT